MRIDESAFLRILMQLSMTKLFRQGLTPPLAALGLQIVVERLWVLAETGFIQN